MALVYVDVDGPCANLLEAWLQMHYEDCGEYIHPADVTDWELAKVAMRGDIYSHLRDEALYEERVQPVEGAVQAINAMRQAGHDVVFLTSSNDISAGPKMRWLVRHGFTEFVNGGHLPDVIVSSRKGLNIGDYLIDDGLHNLRAFKGRGILWDAPYNRHDTAYRRVTCWDEVVTLVLPVVEVWR